MFAACGVTQHFAGIQHLAGIEHGFDLTHETQRRVTCVALQELPLCEADSVLAGNRSAQCHRGVEDLFQCGLGADDRFGVAGIGDAGGV